MKLISRKPYETAIARTRPERMAWWNEARYGMFVHWGLYSLLGRHEWAQAIECIPPAEYQKLADQFKPRPNAPREWVRLAKAAGMKYMVMTTKHHEGFCLWDSALTDYNSVRRGCGRDLVAEYVEACRAGGLKVGFYYSLMDWHHPDGGRAVHDPAARRRFLEYTRGLVDELMRNYGKIDILWYDVPRPMKSYEGWESLAMNQMVRSLQPDILINNRSILDEDFSTPEGHVRPAEEGRGWEACMTFNDTSWGWMPSAAADAHTPRAILKMLNTACAAKGNLLLNIGPAPDGTVPEESVAPLKTVGKWLERNGEAVYGKLDRAPWGFSACGGSSRKGNTVYFWCRCWSGGDMGLGGFQTRLKSARFLVSGEPIEFEQSRYRIVLKNPAAKHRDRLTDVTVIALEFASAPQHVSQGSTPALQLALHA